MMRHVTLSDGSHATVALSPDSWTQYYPDLPHCAVCDFSAAEMSLVTCDAVVRGKTTGRCGCYLCTGHSVTYEGQNLCPEHVLALMLSPTQKGADLYARLHPNHP